MGQAYKVRYGLGPRYLKDHLPHYVLPWPLRSSMEGLLWVPSSDDVT